MSEARNFFLLVGAIFAVPLLTGFGIFAVNRRNRPKEEYVYDGETYRKFDTSLVEEFSTNQGVVYRYQRVYEDGTEAYSPKWVIGNREKTSFQRNSLWPQGHKKLHPSGKWAEIFHSKDAATEDLLSQSASMPDGTGQEKTNPNPPNRPNNPFPSRQLGEMQTNQPLNTGWGSNQADQFRNFNF